MGDKNMLTEKLLVQGYTADNHPDYVKWYANMNEFEYTSEFLRASTWEAPCGVMRKGEFTHGYGWVNGICWRVENDNYNFSCPYRKKECELFHPALKDSKWGGKCSWHMTDKPYDYNNSAEKIKDEKHKLTLENLEKKFGYPGMIHCACCHINEDTCEVYFEFDPSECIRFVHNGCDNQTCYSTGKKRNLKKGNIYYDTKVTTEFREGFIVEPRVTITKGKKLFDEPKRITDMELYLKMFPACVYEREKYSHEHSKLLFDAEYYGAKYDLEIINVRIESRPSRDLMQDLQDIREGIEVTHESDKVKEKKEQKSQRRADAKDKKVLALEKKILKTGYNNLEESDKHRVRKFIDRKRISELERERSKPKPEKSKQMELSDFLKN
jgi:hypothetical protein